MAFQPDAAVIEERRLPWAARSVIYIVAALLISAALWATFSRVDRVVTARGKLITIDPLMVVQPLETAVIRSINVGVGDYVRAGAVLATLDPTFTESQEVATRERLNSMRTEAMRLEAEIYGRPFPPDPADQSLDAKYLALQTAIHSHRLAEYAAAISASDADIARFEAALTTNRTAQQGLKERLKVIGQIESMRQELMSLSAGSKLSLLTTQLDRMSLGDQLAEKQISGEGAAAAGRRGARAEGEIPQQLGPRGRREAHAGAAGDLHGDAAARRRGAPALAGRAACAGRRRGARARPEVDRVGRQGGRAAGHARAGGQQGRGRGRRRQLRRRPPAGRRYGPRQARRAAVPAPRHRRRDGCG